MVAGAEAALALAEVLTAWTAADRLTLRECRLDLCEDTRGSVRAWHAGKTVDDRRVHGRKKPRGWAEVCLSRELRDRQMTDGNEADDQRGGLRQRGWESRIGQAETYTENDD